MRTTVNEDLVTGNPLNNELEDHHIYQYSLTKSGISKTKRNSIANKILLSRASHRNISNINPDKYLVDIVKAHKDVGSIGDLERRMQTCFIP